jgi:TAG lipase/steryl ester hydrolase/phospholipase A2/LPA acyltransferase
MNHVGVLSALMHKRMLPRIISGTSAGSIVAGACCTRTDDELPQLLNDFIHGNLNVFQDSRNPETVYDHIARLLKIGTATPARLFDVLTKQVCGLISLI